MTEFIGFPRPDGSVGIRNHVLLIGLDEVGVDVCHKVAGWVKTTLRVISRTGDGRILSEVVGHPNVAGSVLVGEGLEEQDMAHLVSDLQRWGKTLEVIEIAGQGFIKAMARVTQIAIEIVRDVSTHRRELMRFSKLLPVLFPEPDDLSTGVLVAFLRRLREEKGRCLWVEKGAKNQKIRHPEIKANLAGVVGSGEAPGPDPGVYRYMGPESHRAILRTIWASGVQVMVFPSRPKPYMANALIPGLGFSVRGDFGPEQICDLDLGQKEDRKLAPEEASLLLFSEILATASGKLTRGEVLRDVLIL